MRIKCPYCGERALEEFTYRGDATVTRPTSLEPGADRRVGRLCLFPRQPAGLHREHWHHGAGCHAWLVVTRDITTHEIVAVEFAAEGARDMTRPAQPARQGRADRPVASRSRFSFDGEQLTGYPGDTLASALLANGVRLVGRSFKYHRPRGIFTAGSEEPNALVELRSGARREPNTRATTIELYDGLDAASQNRWPSLRLDLLAVEPAVRRRSSAPASTTRPSCGRPRFWEKLYEPAIRRAAGLGRAAGAPDPDHYEKANAFCDVLVIGGGPAGLAAALAAARSGARVILCEEDFRLGGRLLAERCEIDGASGDSNGSTAAEAELAEPARCAASCARTTVFGVYDGGTYAAHRARQRPCAAPPAHEPRQRLWRIVAKRAVLAAGAIERPIVFGDNDRPGVMLAGAVRTYVNRFGVDAGQARGRLRRQRRRLPHRRRSRRRRASRSPRWSMPARAPRRARKRRRSGASRAISRAPRSSDVRGGHGVRGVDDRRRERQDRALRLRSGRRVRRLEPDRPSHHAISTASRVWSDALSALVPGALPPGMTRRRRGARAASASAHAWPRATTPARRRRPTCGFTAPAARGSRRRRTKPRDVEPALAGRATVAARPSSISRTTSTVTDVKLAAREGFRSLEHLKRYTTLGMATDQGKTPTSTAWRCSPRSPGGMSARSAPRPSARPIPRSPSAPSPAIIAARISARRGWRRRMPGRRSRARCSSRPGRGCARTITRSAGEDRLDASRTARSGECPRARRRLRRLDPRQDRRAGQRTPASSSTASMPTPSRRCRSARRAMG